MNNEKTSLEKSHSVWSNTKLTLVCLILAFFVSMVWFSLTLRFFIGNIYFAIMLAASVIGTVICLCLTAKFKR